MATFKVGQRVKITVHGSGPAGSEGTITELDQPGPIFFGNGPFHRVLVPTVPTDDPNGWLVSHAHLVPLTDPDEEQWAIDAVRKVTKPQHVEPVAPKRDVVPG